MRIKTPDIIGKYFICHYDNRTILIDKCSQYIYEKYNKTFTQYLLDYNNLTPSILPVCKYCNDKKVVLLPPVNKITLSGCCSSYSCRTKLLRSTQENI